MQQTCETVDVEEWQEGHDLVCAPVEVLLLALDQHEHVGGDVFMREHDALGEASGAGGVHEERDVLDGVDFCAAPFERGAWVYELAEV